MAVTIKDVARLAGVGAGTVSRVINDEANVSAAARRKVREAIEILNYMPNSSASRLRRNSTSVLALIVPVIDHPFFSRLAQYVTEEADRFGYSVLLVASQQRVQKEHEIIELLHRKEVDGAIFVTHFDYEEKLISNCRIVALDRHFGENIPFVTTDNYAATRKAVEYLIEKGCKKIGFVGTKPVVGSEVTERERAYRDALKSRGMRELVLSDVVPHGTEKELVERFFNEFGPMDGVFASGYMTGQAVYEYAFKHGIKVPEELQIAVYDGSFAPWRNGRELTAVVQPLDEIAKALVRTLLKTVNGEEVPHKTVVETRFVPADSTK